ncbi:phosphatidylglycerophosphate synthase [Reticulomyxa filosa]|uniref:Phosphatidylglycerophosphate synthase n=1 Tax=Reticulomyxa filosa TaxID=46433 RepID=X6LQ21_RETFI|nr:phosphatidylglycerophosphate synthase [Reticulomyxa filosa]|eukprot:ETO03466.1 phosphatidylglycerophosphate synthase [Reticulomyxa filosa]
MRGNNIVQSCYTLLSSIHNDEKTVELHSHLLKIRVVGIEKMEIKKLYLNAHMKELASMTMSTIEYKKVMALKEEEDKKMKVMKSNDNDNDKANNDENDNDNKIKNKEIQKKTKKNINTATSVNANANVDENSDKNKDASFSLFPYLEEVYSL